jgi:hypothetical protein
MFLTLVLVVQISESTNVFALEQPAAEQIAQYESDGTLAERIKNAKALGNHLASISPQPTLPDRGICVYSHGLSRFRPRRS